MKNKIAAFTLVELLIAVTVMLILSTFIFLSAGSSSKRAKDDKLISDLNNVSIGLDQYNAAKLRKYPDCGSGAFVACTITNNGSYEKIATKLNPYLSQNSIEIVNQGKIKYITDSANSYKAALYILKSDLALDSDAERKRICDTTVIFPTFTAGTTLPASAAVCKVIIK